MVWAGQIWRSGSSRAFPTLLFLPPQFPLVLRTIIEYNTFQYSKIDPIEYCGMSFCVSYATECDKLYLYYFCYKYLIVSYSYQCFMHIYSDISFYHFLDTNVFGYLFLLETFYHLIQIYLVILFISKSNSGRVSQIFEYSTIYILFNINIHLYHIYVVFSYSYKYIWIFICFIYKYSQIYKQYVLYEVHLKQSNFE